MNISRNQQLVLDITSLADRIDRRVSASLSNIKGISLAEYRLVRALADSPGGQATRVGLAAQVGLTASGVTRALAPLEKIGYIATVRDERDARKALASLTPAGEELVADASGVMNDVSSFFEVDVESEQVVRDVLSDLAGAARHS